MFIVLLSVGLLTLLGPNVICTPALYAGPWTSRQAVRWTEPRRGKKKKKRGRCLRVSDGALHRGDLWGDRSQNALRAERSGVTEVCGEDGTDTGRCADAARRQRERHSCGERTSFHRTHRGFAEKSGAAAEPVKASWLCRCGAGSPTREESTWSWWGNFFFKAVRLHSYRWLLTGLFVLPANELFQHLFPPIQLTSYVQEVLSWAKGTTLIDCPCSIMSLLYSICCIHTD